MKYLSLILVVVVLASSCTSTKQETTAVTTPSLVLKWTSDTLLTTCESVIYDKDNDVLYVANIAGDPEGKDGNGFISKLGLDGKVVNAKWVTGMDAPKGMGLWNGKLYVADIDRIHEVDIAAGKISNSYPVEGAKFLNDVTVDASGKVYASDSNTKDVVVLENGVVSKWLTATDGPNGLLSEGNTMMMALWTPQTLNMVDIATKEVTMKTDSIENPDGIEAVGDGGYLVSSWNGMVHYVDPAWKKTLVLDTRGDSATNKPAISAADIEYIPAKNLLLVPTFFNNTVMAYELVK